jgi:ABC-type branched-subunit amino acid transport system substrate-binding protein
LLWLRRVAVLVVLGLVAGCGSRLSDDQLAIARAPRQGGGSVVVGATSSTVGSGTNGDGSATADTTATGTGSGSSAGPSGPASGGPGGPGVAVCKGKTASDVGVTPTEIRVANLSTIGGPVPGFGQTGRNGLRAYMAMVNSQGGVCGRKMVMNPGDDRLDAGANKAETQRLMPTSFAFVSNTSVADDGGATILANTNVPTVGLTTTPEASALSNSFSPSPLNPKSKSIGATALIQYFKAKYSLKAAAVIWPGAPVARVAGERYQYDLEQAGIPVVIAREVAITETNFSGVAADIAQKNVDIVITVLEFNAIARLAKALETEHYAPKVPFFGAQTYGRKFLQVAGSAAEGVKLAVTFEPFESRSQVREVDMFLTWYERVNPGADIDFFSIMAWVAARMFVDALRAVGPEPTRDKLLAKLKTFTDVDAGGFVGRINPAQKQPARCFLVVEVIKGAWVKTDPKGVGFKC